MSLRITAASIVVALAVAAPAVSAQMPPSKSADAQKAPNRPDPNDRGGDFTITGCLARGTQAGGPALFTITHVQPGQANVGEGTAVGAMGGGTPVTGVTHSSAADKQDPPQVVRGEYRIVSSERTNLNQFVGQQIEARGRLRDSASSAMKTSTASAANDIFEASSVKKLSGSCAAK